VKTVKDFPDLRNYLEQEDETTNKTIRKFRKDIKLYERSFSLCSEMVHYLCKRTKEKSMDSTAKEAILLILPRIMQSLQSIRLLTSKGYYYDASIIARSFLEGMGLCAYLSLNEEEAESWIEGNKLKVPTIKLVDYIPKLLMGSYSKTDLKPVYGRLSDYVHTNVEAVISLVSDWHSKQSGKISVGFTPIFDESKVIKIAHSSMLMAVVLELMFRNELTQGKKNRIAKLLKQFNKERKLTPKQT
jgi:hypothetical protein